jgi:ribose transport system ATP-binding protein
MSVQVNAISKRFGSIVALSAARLNVAAGEIHALLGANGCGKSTLCKIIAGAISADSGTILVEGQTCMFDRPADAEAVGIGLFYQELSLIPQMTVAQNIWLGREPCGLGGFVNHKAMNETSDELIRLFQGVVGPGLRANAVVSTLPPDQRQIVEILKVFSRDPRVIIMDEATAALDGRQAKRFFEILSMKKGEGISTIMISHRLDEVFDISDRITVMRNGQTTAELETAAITQSEVVMHMIGKSTDSTAPRQPLASSLPPQREPRLVARNLSSSRLKNISLELRPGEIVGLGGLQGQGQSALLQSLFGALPIDIGNISLDGQPISLTRPGVAIRNGFAYVSGDRARDAALAGRSIFENLVVALIMRERRSLIPRGSLGVLVNTFAQSLQTKFNRLDAPIGSLSGGNQQKIFIARWLAAKPRILLLDDPTKGIDLGAKADLFAIVRRLASEGASVLIYSSEDAELIDNCDRVLVLNNGSVVVELAGADITPFNLTRGAFGEAA